MNKVIEDVLRSLAIGVLVKQNKEKILDAFSKHLEDIMPATGNAKYLQQLLPHNYIAIDGTKKLTIL